MKDLESRVAIITGGGQGIGLGIARVFAKYGVKLVITGRSRETLDKAAVELTRNGTRVLVVPGDVSVRETAQHTVEQTVLHFGRLDILVNNAQTLYPQTPLSEYTDEILHGSIDSGLKGTIHFMRAAYTALKVRGGSIINVGSCSGTQGIVGSTAYAAAKEGIRAASRVAAREWGKDNIRINVINPAVFTSAVREYFDREPQAEAVFRSQLSLGKFAEVEDVGELAAFLASPTCFITGQTINIDGGQVMP
jgi:NAD(P)-dependent dehydrogenase (short-subunit alcohol dehydrogenase family)